MEARTFYRFSAPSLILMFTLLVIPLGMAVWYGFHYMTFGNISNPTWIGLENYRSALTDSGFWAAVGFTLTVMAVVVPTSMFLGFVMALLVDQVTGPIRGVFVTVYLLPMLIVPVIGGVLFRKLVDPSGIVSWIYREIFSEALILSPTSMKILILVNTIWLITPFSFIILFAGLQTIPKELSEAASIDSANAWQQIRYVVLPHLKTLILLSALINVMDMFRLFDNVYSLTGMNPVYQSDTVMTYIYRAALDVRLLGLGNAMAVITVLAILVMLIPLLRMTFREQSSGRA